MKSEHTRNLKQHHDRIMNVGVVISCTEILRLFITHITIWYSFRPHRVGGPVSNEIYIAAPAPIPDRSVGHDGKYVSETCRQYQFPELPGSHLRDTDVSTLDKGKERELTGYFTLITTGRLLCSRRATTPYRAVGVSSRQIGPASQEQLAAITYYRTAFVGHQDWLHGICCKWNVGLLQLDCRACMTRTTEALSFGQRLSNMQNMTMEEGRLKVQGRQAKDRFHSFQQSTQARESNILFPNLLKTGPIIFLRHRSSRLKYRFHSLVYVFCYRR